jgi:hypothetical protein
MSLNIFTVIKFMQTRQIIVQSSSAPRQEAEDRIALVRSLAALQGVALSAQHAAAAARTLAHLAAHTGWSVPPEDGHA